MTTNALDFTGKVALVTGAASGMGLAAAQAFAEAGAAVALADFREDAVKAESEKLARAGYKVIGLRCDVRDDTRGGTDGGAHGRRVWPARRRL